MYVYICIYIYIYVYSLSKIIYRELVLQTNAKQKILYTWMFRQLDPFYLLKNISIYIYGQPYISLHIPKFPT